MISVLVVDDHVAVGLGTKALIERYDDIEADVFHDSEEIREVMHNKQYDVYLIDLQMPKINGLELSKYILSVQPEAAILIFTGFDVLPHYNLLIDNGVLGVLSKTSSEKEVVNAIRHASTANGIQPARDARATGTPATARGSVEEDNRQAHNTPTGSHIERHATGRRNTSHLRTSPMDTPPVKPLDIGSYACVTCALRGKTL